MAKPYDRFIRRDRLLTGRKLLEAFTAAGKPPSVGGGLMVSAFGQQASITNTKRQIIPKSVVIFPALALINTLFAPNRWTYTWAEADLDANGEYTIPKPDGRASGDAENGGFGEAKNLAEQLNTASIAAHGVDLTPPVDGSVDVVPIPLLTPVLLFRAKHSDGFFRYSFNATNAINFTCAP